MLHVAMVIQRFRPDFGGQGVQVEQLCRALARRGHQSVVICATRGRPSGWETLDGYRIRRVKADVLPGSYARNRLWMPTFGARVLVELRRLERVDAVHVHGLHDGFFGARTFCRLRKIPLVFEMTLMGADDPATVLASRPFAARARHQAFRRADAYVAMSKAFFPAYEAAGMPADRLHLIPQGVDTRRFRPLGVEARRAVRDELGIAPDMPMIVFVGSLIERKGVDVLLDAWSRVHHVRAGTSLVLVGRDNFPAGSSEAAFLETHVARLSAEARRGVVRTGLRDDPERVLGAADVFVLPSRREGFGSVIIEAMAAGLPSIVTEMPGITDFVFTSPDTSRSKTTHADGIVVPQEDAGALADALVSLLAEPDRARAIGQRAIETARDRFDFDTVVAPAYERLYTDLVTRNQHS